VHSRRARVLNQPKRSGRLVMLVISPCRRRLIASAGNATERNRPLFGAVFVAAVWSGCGLDAQSAPQTRMATHVSYLFV
jgi:hypothetical protein